EAAPSDEVLAGMHARLTTAMETANVGLADILVQTEATLLETDRTNSALRDLIRQRMLWTPSHAPIRKAWFGELAARWEVGKLVARVAESWNASVAWVGGHPAWATLAALGLAGLLGLRPRLWAWIEQRRPLLRSVRTDRIGHTLAALGCT